MLTERLEIRLPAGTLAMLRQEAERRRISVGRLVREAIDLMLKEDRDARPRAAEALFQVGAPVADWPEMEREIEAAHLQDATLRDATPSVREASASSITSTA